jgi:hypothetical protein
MEPDAGLIEIRIARIDQLFNSFDPSPFDERDLDDDAESHIAGWARELPKDVPIRLLLHMPKEEAQRAQERGLAGALTHYFEVASAMDRKRSSRTLSVGVALSCYGPCGSKTFLSPQMDLNSRGGQLTKGLNLPKHSMRTLPRSR